MVIYKTTFPNGKIYIGQSTKCKDNYFGSGRICKNAIKKYGKDSLKKEILKRCKTQRELDIWEFIFIRKFNSCDINIGYNVLPGTANQFGSGSPMKNPRVVLKVSKSLKTFYKTKMGKRVTKEKEKKRMQTLKENPQIIENLSRIGKMLIGEKNPNFGKNWTDDMKADLRSKMLGRYDGEKNPNFGKKWTDEMKAKLRDKMIGNYEGSKNPMFGKKRITNGKVNTIIKDGEELPEGFRFGMTRGLR